MSLPLLATGVVTLLVLGYRYYGAFIARQYNVSPETQTPAVRMNDGIDFVPTKPFYLLGQHFSAIAAAGPIAGPILAATQFGWAPAVLWISFGVVFIGAVHDFSTLIASVRHDAKSIAEVVKTRLGPTAGITMLIFIWIALIYVIVAFADVTASTFVTGDAELKGLEFTFNPGGAVAAASVMYLCLAVLMGLVDRYLKPPLWLSSIVFVPATLVVVWLGTKVSTAWVLDAKTWVCLILGYCMVASHTPVWALLQPRGYLGGFVLYLALAVGVIGIFFGGFEIQQPAFKGFEVPGATGSLFPFLFVTIACGACSGFHGLVCSGTTSKQIANEKHCHPVGFGAMLLEGLVAIIALATLMVAAPSDIVGKGAGAIYGLGLGRFMTVVIGDQHATFATTFGAMAFSTFVFDTLDVTTRLGRYILVELFGWKARWQQVLATAITCALPLGFVLIAQEGAWKSFWTLFGTSNQLLAALSLMGISVWLKQTGKRYWYTLLPTVFVGTITLWSLLLQLKTGLLPEAQPLQRINAGVCAVFLVLALSVFTVGAKALLARDSQPKPGPLTA
jgi:carbon starvation protein